MQRISQVTLAPANQSVNNIAQSQTPGAGGNLTLNGSAVTSGVATLDMARRLLLTGAANDSGRTFTITGTDRAGRVLVETLAGPNAATVTTVNDFLTVSQVAIDAAAAGALQVGTGGKVSSQWIPFDRYGTMDMGVAVEVTGTINYTVEHAYSDPFSAGVGVLPNGGLTAQILTPFPHSVLAAQTANKDGNYSTPVSAVRLTINSYTNGATAKLTLTPGLAGDDA